MDFSKAFDKVEFLVTLRKIKQLGITGKVSKWIYSFLTGRTQTVIVNGIKSEDSVVRSGVPQGQSWVHYYSSFCLEILINQLPLHLYLALQMTLIFAVT